MSVCWYGADLIRPVVSSGWGGLVVVVVLIGRLLDGWLLVCTQISLGRLVNLVSVLKREKLPRAGILRSAARLIVKLDRQVVNRQK